MEMTEPVGEPSPETQETIKPPNTASPPPPHPPFCASLADYTLQSSSTSPIDSHTPRNESDFYSLASYEEQIGPSRRGSSLLPIDEYPNPASRSHQTGSPSGPLGSPAASVPTSHRVSPVRARTSTASEGGSGMARVVVDRAAVAPLPAATFQHLLPLHGQAWRPSPFLHEIQPPSRRLSSRQMLLLIPFGGPLPAGALSVAGGFEMGGTGMSRGNTSMGSGAGMGIGRGANSTGMGMSTQMRMSAGEGERSSGGPRRESGRSGEIQWSRGSGVGKAPVPSSMGVSGLGEMGPAARVFPRTRLSLEAKANVVAHSRLASAPMTTIRSESSEGNSSGERARTETFMSRQEVGMVREGLAHDGQVQRGAEGQRQISMSAGAGAEMDRARLRPIPATVAMMRSNSLPVLTLRELDALKEKDGELGIQRGGDWAWVSRDATVDENGEELSDNDSTVSGLPSAAIITPVEHTLSRTFPAFREPFAAYTFGNHHPLAAIPVATSADYHYIPTYHEPRRMSDGPGSSGVSPASRQRQSEGARRPSAPVTGTNRLDNTTSRTTQRYVLGQHPPQAPAFVLPQGPTSAHTSPIESSGGIATLTPLSPSPAPTRPRITRYKSSPARSTGLGLNIVLCPNGESSSSMARPMMESVAGSGSDTPGDESRGASPRRTSVVTVGQWAEVDFLDPVAAASEIIPVVPHMPLPIVSPTTSVRPLNPASRESTSSAASIAGSTHSAPPALAASAAHLIAGFEAFTFKGRNRFESVDSALPLMPGGSGGRLSVPPLGAGEGYNPSNRGDRVVSAGAPRLMTNPGAGMRVGTGAGSAEDEVADGGWRRRESLGMDTFARLRRVAKRRESDDSSEMRARHWSERRGSWAEGWGKKE